MVVPHLLYHFSSSFIVELCYYMYTWFSIKKFYILPIERTCVFVSFRILTINNNYFAASINRLLFIMKILRVSFEVGTELLSIMYKKLRIQSLRSL
jgi:hypothetical protein